MHSKATCTGNISRTTYQSIQPIRSCSQKYEILSEKQIYVHNIIYGMITRESSKGCDVLRNS